MIHVLENGYDAGPDLEFPAGSRVLVDLSRVAVIFEFHPPTPPTPPSYAVYFGAPHPLVVLPGDPGYDAVARRAARITWGGSE